MRLADRWLLPDGIEEVLPPEAWQVEHMRRKILDLYSSWGYDLVIPPHIEFLDSLITGSGSDLDLMTFKVTDQLSGRTLGLRADTTPAVARIDAHYLKSDSPQRLCYAGSVFHTRPAYMTASRTPIQIGAELYGHAGPESDLEVITLMLETLTETGVQGVHLDLGHVGIFREVVKMASLQPDVEKQLFDALQRKAKAEMLALAEDFITDPAVADMLLALPDLCGERTVLAQARKRLSHAPESVTGAIDELDQLAQQVAARYPSVSLYFDLGELRGYNYHTGVVFAACVAGEGQSVAQGGRYDGIGKAFGRARPATGFSTDLKVLMRLGVQSKPESKGAILAPQEADADVVRQLRSQGERVIYRLVNGSGTAACEGCDRELKLVNDSWQVVSVV